MHLVPRNAQFCPDGSLIVRSPLAARPAAMQKESVLSSSSPHRRTSHITKRRVTGVALVGVSALLAAAVQSGAASAAPGQAPRAGKVNPGAVTLKLTASQRAELIRDADAAKATTARDLGLGAA